MALEHVDFSLYQIVYSSRPFGYDDAMLAGILVDARRCNTRDKVTGALICRSDIYLQLLEGPERSVRKTMAKIEIDDRHADVVVHHSRRASRRLFGDWAMLHDPAFSILLPGKAPEPGDIDRLRRQDVMSIFDKLSGGAAA